MVIDLEPVLKGSGVHLGRHPRCVDKRIRLQAEPRGGVLDLRRRPAGDGPFAARRDDPYLAPHHGQRLLEGTAGGCGEAARVPVEPEKAP